MTLPRVDRFRSFLLACLAPASSWACGPAPHPSSSALAAQGASAASTTTTSLTPVSPIAAPFSGEIIYRQTAVPNDSTRESRDLGNLHYFVSGPHWKHVDAAGDTVAIYDPDRNLIHYFKPKPETRDASVDPESATFEHLTEVKTILGHPCRAIRQTSGEVSLVVFYDPSFFVEPKLYRNHKFGHWGELLALTQGGLTLASRTELPEGTIVSEAVSIRPMTFEPEFWSQL